MELQSLSSDGSWRVAHRLGCLLDHARAHCVIWDSVLTAFANDSHRKALAHGYGVHDAQPNLIGKMVRMINELEAMPDKGTPHTVRKQPKRTWKAPTHGKFDAPALEFSVHCWSERCAGSFHCRCDCNGCVEAVTQEGAGV